MIPTRSALRSSGAVASLLRLFGVRGGRSSQPIARVDAGIRLPAGAPIHGTTGADSRVSMVAPPSQPLPQQVAPPTPAKPVFTKDWSRMLNTGGAGARPPLAPKPLPPAVLPKSGKVQEWLNARTKTASTPAPPLPPKATATTTVVSPGVRPAAGGVTKSVTRVSGPAPGIVTAPPPATDKEPPGRNGPAAQVGSSSANALSPSLPPAFVGNVGIPNDSREPRSGRIRNPVKSTCLNSLFGSESKRRSELSSYTREIVKFDIAQGVVKKVTLQGEVGRLSGILSSGMAQQPPGAERKVVLFLHGSGEPAESSSSRFYPSYLAKGYDCLAVNCRGFGGSDGTPSESGMYADARIMFKYLVNDLGIKPENIMLHGYSLGAAVAAQLAGELSAQKVAVGGLLLDRPMSTLRKGVRANNGAGALSRMQGAVAKKILGSFSVKKNLQGYQAGILLLTDSESLGAEGEILRTKLEKDGYNVRGERTSFEHSATVSLMDAYITEIDDFFSGRESVSGGIN